MPASNSSMGLPDTMTMPLDWTQFLALLAAALVAAVVRGYSGFGFSAIVIAGASLVIEPAALVPALFILEIIASVYMLPGVRHQIDWPNFWPLFAGCVVGLPAGQFLLVHLHTDTIRVCLSLGILFSTALLWRGYTFGLQMTRPLAGLIGFLLGFGSGMASMGGLVAMAIFLGVNYPAAQTRAMFVAIFFAMYVYGVGISAHYGLITHTTVWIVLVMLLPLFIGIFLGQRQYLASAQESFRKLALVLLTILATIGIVRVILI